MKSSETKTALVTGAAHRIGRAIALNLADAGWAIGVHYGKSETAARKLADEITNTGGRAATFKADLGDEAETRDLIKMATRELGRVTCLVNNASVFESDAPDTEDRRIWDRHMAVNLRAPFVLAQEFVAALKDDGEGNIINLVDQRVGNLTPYFTSYTLSKAGLWTLTQTLALAFAPKVRVNAVGPGPTLPSDRQSEDEFKRQYGATPLARQVGEEEIAAAIRFILASPSMTGQMITLDSGQQLGWAIPSGDGPDE
ncbi:MAG: SDR family oxidoreductase [Rhodospirillales bacterium]|nr:SDR family oxidoreductase [Rhodospirillales bacterium]